MRRYFALAAVVAIPILLIARTATPGQVQARPGAGTGVVTVTGTVDLGNAPPLRTLQSGDWRVAQQGDWKVAVTTAPPAVRAPLGFVRPGSRYEVWWTSSERDVIRVEEVGPGGWVRGTVGERNVWLNLDGARSLSEVR